MIPEMLPPTLEFRILIVDDDADMRDALASYFRQKGLSVVTAKDGLEAIRAIEAAQDAFQIVLTDLVMPQKSGLDVLKAAKDKFVDVHVVLITGYASLESAIEAVRLGAYDYLTKPFKFSEIEILLKNIGERIGLLEQNRDLHMKIRDLHDRLDSLSEGKTKVDRSMRELEGSMGATTRKLDHVIDLVTGLKEQVKELADAAQKNRRPAPQAEPAPEIPRDGTRSIRL